VSVSDENPFELTPVSNNGTSAGSQLNDLPQAEAVEAPHRGH
jgi:hypothetical protein